MRAMVLRQICNILENPTPLEMEEMEVPEPAEGEVLVKVSACGVCHTELDEIEGRTPPSSLPVILGHQVVGRVERPAGGGTPAAGGGRAAAGGGSAAAGGTLAAGDRVGVAWIHSSCGTCEFCRAGNENLCAGFKATGRDAHGGYAEYLTVPEESAFVIPEGFTDVEAAPLLCAGAIGYRSLRLTELEDGQRLGLTGFGASAHLVLKMVRHRYPRTDVFVFARSPAERQFARELGAVWAGDTEEKPPEKLHSIIDTTPVWKPVVEAMLNLVPGGRLVVNAIRKESVDRDYLLKLDYPTHLWMEKEIKSVANVARRDVSEFLKLAAEIPIKPAVQEFGLEEANRALYELKTSKIRGAKVLRL